MSKIVVFQNQQLGTEENCVHKLNLYDETECNGTMKTTVTFWSDAPRLVCSWSKGAFRNTDNLHSVRSLNASQHSLTSWHVPENRGSILQHETVGTHIIVLVLVSEPLQHM